MSEPTTINLGPAKFVIQDFIAGTDLWFNFDIRTNPGGVPVDISGDTFEVFIKTKAGNVMGAVSYDALLEKVVVEWTEVQTATIPPGCWYIWVYWTAGDTTTVPILGRIEVSKGGK